jgi:predicted metal-dependent hydrolase
MPRQPDNGAMNTLTVRRLLVDLDTPLPRNWCGGAFRTAFFNALSMSFPAGEQLFIDSVRKGVAALSADRQAAFAEEVQGFIGQEATHRRIHQRFNAHLERQGLVNRWEARIVARRGLVESIDLRNWVAVTAATEHLTALFAEHLLAHPEVLQGAEPRWRDLWLWHCSEESEHRSTAFDLYTALGGGHDWRCGIFKTVTQNFAIDLARQTLRNLWHDGSWWRPSTWADGWRLLFGPQGMVTLGRPAWRRYLRADFHPSQGDAQDAERWLVANAAIAPPVRAAAGAAAG